jgi:hypothetical protein
MNHEAEAHALIGKLEGLGEGTYPMGIAEAYAYCGQKNRAFFWLDKAFLFKDAGLHFIKGDPLLRNLEGDPRYGAFLRKMNLPE